MNSLPSWQENLSNAITDPEELLKLLQLDLNLLDKAKQAAKKFPLRVPRNFVARMKTNDIDDPLLKQILPIGEELKFEEGYSNDPLGETEYNPIPGLLHKYANRVLLTLTNACGINCRFCFRREFPYAENNPGIAGWNLALDYVQKNSAINEIILSGGDPLVISDKMLYLFSEKISSISHIKRLRIHSRMPIVMPERITAEFLEWVKSLKQRLILVVHCNHAQEIDESVIKAMKELAKAGVILLNQSVLLRNVNDNSKTLIELSEALFSAQIMPYYIHLLDKVNGAAHFDTPIEKAKQLQIEISKYLPGYLVPKFVYEKAGSPSKIVLTWE